MTPMAFLAGPSPLLQRRPAGSHQYDQRRKGRFLEPRPRKPTRTIIRAAIVPTPPVVLQDRESLLTSGERARLETQLRELDEAGTHVRVLTQGTGTAPGTAAVQIFGLSEETALIVADRRGGSLLNFRVGSALRERLPPSFWAELGNRYGNKFYVDEHGADGALLDAVRKIRECSDRVCRVVPGISQDQLYVGIGCAGVAGAVAGAAARTGGRRFNAPYVALFSPLWSIFLVSFAIGPLVTRVPGLSPELGVVLATFAGIAGAIWAWIPARFGAPGSGREGGGSIDE